MKKVVFEKIKIQKGGYWFSAEYYENDLLKLGEGCHFSQKNEVIRIKNKFNKLKGLSK